MNWDRNSFLRATNGERTIKPLGHFGARNVRTLGTQDSEHLR
jgi:hypothetical protein